MPGQGIVEHALKHSTGSTPELPPPRLGLLDLVLIREHAALDEDSPCAFGKPDRTRRTNHHRAYTRQRIPPLDYGLPEDFSAYLLNGLQFTIVPGAGCVDFEQHNRGSDNAGDDTDFASLVPLDCITSTPIAISRRLASKKPFPEPGSKFPSLGSSPPNLTPSPVRKTLV